MCSACTSCSPAALKSAAEQSARSLMLGLNAAAPQHGAHLVCDALEPADQHCEPGGVERHGVERHGSATSVTAQPRATLDSTTGEVRSVCSTTQ